jgi:hypothetical protein
VLRFVALLPLLLVALSVRTAGAQEGSVGRASGRRVHTVGSYTFGGGALRVDTDGRRVAIYAQDGDGSRVLVFADPLSIGRWLRAADALIGREGGAPRDEDTPPLSHRDSSVGGSVVLTRAAASDDAAARFYLTVTGDADHIALVPLTPMDARILVSALRRAAEEAKGGM